MDKSKAKFIMAIALLSVFVAVLLIDIAQKQFGVRFIESKKYEVNANMKRELAESIKDSIPEPTQVDAGYTMSDFKEVGNTDGNTIMFLPDDEILKSFPENVIIGIYHALKDELGTDTSDFFVASWDKDDLKLYTVTVGFNSGAMITIDVDSETGAYKVNKTMVEAEDEAKKKDIRGEAIFTFPAETVEKFSGLVNEYANITNPELQSIKEYNCCYVVWYNDAGTDRFLRFSKNTYELEKRGHYDVIKQEYVVDWEKEGETE